MPPAIKIHALQFQVEPVQGLNAYAQPGTSWFFCYWPDDNAGPHTRKPRKLWNGHPDRTVLDSRKGDVLLHRIWQGRVTQHRLLQVRVFRSSLCLAEWEHVWAGSVAEAVGRVGERVRKEIA